MKKLAIALAVIALAFGACKEVDQVDDPGVQEGIADWLPGTWNLTEVRQENGVISINGFETATFTGVGEKVTGQLVFSEAPNIYTNTASYTNNMTVTIAGQATSQSVPVTGSGSGTWKLDAEDNIELTSRTTEIFTVLESSSSRIKVRFPFLQTQDNSGITTTTSADVIAVYQK